MYKKASKKIAEALIGNNVVKSEDREIYEYGFADFYIFSLHHYPLFNKIAPCFKAILYFQYKNSLYFIFSVATHARMCYITK